MKMRPVAVGVGDGEAQLPEADVLELDVELRAGRRMQHAGGNRNCPWWCPAEPARGRTTCCRGRPGRRTSSIPPDRDAARCRRTCRDIAPAAGAARSSGTPAAPSAGRGPTGVWVMPACLAHRRAAAVAADDVVGPQRAAAGCRRALRSSTCAPSIVLRDAVQRSSHRAFRTFGNSAARLRSTALGGVLRQPLVVGEVDRAAPARAAASRSGSRRAACRRPSARRCRTRAGSSAPRASSASTPQKWKCSSVRWVRF